MHFALINKSSLIAGQHGDMEAMAEAGVKLYNERFAPAWGHVPITGAYYRDAKDVPEGSCIFTWVDDDRDVPGALGYHSQAGNQPYSILMARIILEEAGGGVIDVKEGGCSCASVFGHELFELGINPNVVDWVEMPDGRFLAKEVCDPVQDGIVLVTLDSGVVVAMSDAVYPEYFDMQAPEGGVYSLNGFSRPLGRSSGGYQIIFDPARIHHPDGPIVYEWGVTMPAWQVRMKKKRGRTFRRVEEARKRLAARMLAASVT